MVLLNEAVEVVYAGEKVRGYAVEVRPGAVVVEASFGVREFPSSEVTGLKFMRLEEAR